MNGESAIIFTAKSYLPYNPNPGSPNLTSIGRHLLTFDGDP